MLKKEPSWLKPGIRGNVRKSDTECRMSDAGRRKFEWQELLLELDRLDRQRSLFSFAFFGLESVAPVTNGIRRSAELQHDRHLCQFLRYEIGELL